MMFAHAEFERGIRSLVDALKPEGPGFGERRENQWTASESGTARFIVLIMVAAGCRRLSKSEIFWTRPFICVGSAIFSLTAHGGVSTFGQKPLRFAAACDGSG